MSERTMLAAVARGYGGPEVVRIERVPVPRPAADEILVRVHASTVNRTDCGFRAASPPITRLLTGLRYPKQPIWGSELAGEVAETGPSVSEFDVGDRVVAFSDSRFGGHAQYVTFKASEMVVPIPANMSYVEAAPLLEGAHYALHYIRAANVAKGQRILVNGATGAIGSAGLQLIVELGAHVTATCATPQVEAVEELGAERVIDYLKEDFTRCGETFHMVFDSVGKSSYGRCKALLEPGGAYASSELGPYGQNPIWALWTGRLGGKRVLFPIPKNLKSDAIYLAELAERGAYRPLIDRSYALADIVDAYRYVDTGEKIGNVVIEIPD